MIYNVMKTESFVQSNVVVTIKRCVLSTQSLDVAVRFVVDNLGSCHIEEQPERRSVGYRIRGRS